MHSGTFEDIRKEIGDGFMPFLRKNFRGCSRVLPEQTCVSSALLEVGISLVIATVGA